MAAKPNWRGAPILRTSTLCSALGPVGTDAWGILGTPNRKSVSSVCRAPKRASFAFNSSAIAVTSAISAEATGPAKDQITALLRERHQIRPGQADDFRVNNLTEVAEAAEATTQVMTMLLGSIAAVSLLVGGIGIMNIMLVSVTERTREIGVRMAIGSRGSYIRMQFLAESVILCMVGGLIGVIFGIGLSLGIARVMGWPSYVSPQAATIAFLFSAGTGIFFGYYPAHKAASLDPIEALRYE